MEINSSKKSANLSKTPAQTQLKEYTVNNQRGNVPIILGILILVLVLGGGIYFLGLNQKITNNKAGETVKAEPSTTTTKEPQADNEIITQTYKTTYPKDFYIVNKDKWDVSIQKKGIDTPHPVVGIKYIDSALTQEMKLSGWLPRISTDKQEVKNSGQCKSEINKLNKEIENETKDAIYGGPFGNAYKDSVGDCWFYLVQNAKSNKRTFASYGELEIVEFDSEFEPLNKVKRTDILLKNGMHIIDFYIIGTDRLQPGDTEYNALESLFDNFQFTN